MKAVRIIWHDSFSIDAWTPKELVIIETTENMECQTIGFLLKRTRESITVCHTINTEGSVCGVIQIPRKCIVKIEYLNELLKPIVKNNK